MIRVALVQFHFWEEPRPLDCGHIALTIGDSVVAKTAMGMEKGEVVSFKEIEEGAILEPLDTILRKMNQEDWERYQEQERRKKEILEECRQIVKKHQLPMKLVNCDATLDGGKLIFTFVAESRVDFRELVKDLSRRFQKSIRLQQIGTRDESRQRGDIGVCGRELCCKQFLKTLGSVTSELARSQQVAHRGSERLSGACGRLMCCLAYEETMYQESSQLLPSLGSILKTPQGKGEVVAWNILKQTVNVKLSEGTIVEVPVAGGEQLKELKVKK